MIHSLRFIHIDFPEVWLLMKKYGWLRQAKKDRKRRKEQERERLQIYELTDEEADLRVVANLIKKEVNKDVGWVHKLPIFQEL